MHPVIGLLWYIPYNLILNRIISGRWGPASETLSLVPPNVNFAPTNFEAPPPILETENCVASQCLEFYTEDALMLSQVIYLGLLGALVVNHQFYVDLGVISVTLRALAPPCDASSHPYLYVLIAHRHGADGTECIFASDVICVLPVVPPLSGCPSSPLGSILVVCFAQMGAKLS
ncbi:hypothetical protein DSO57_1034510 [Entomophthora muscae]|uniref:Uncharacterized protein n=1 Tax=Entomophthora muscae TaxID=34485 RepID=A0ACC2U9N2_9FUNG|nr:hypothetical protein DSO57_1034510 [Entomophthora muscae]